MHGGHFIQGGGHNATFFSEINVHAQCAGCNLFKHGNLIEYTIRMIDKYGAETVNQLRKESQKAHQFTEKELRAIIEKYANL